MERFTPAALLLLIVLLPAAAPAQEALPRIDGGDPARGKAAIERHACTACHVIPGVPGYGSNVGPPLHKMALRGYIGGVLPNMPDDMVRWLRNPPAIDPRTVMPNLGITEAEAKDMAAYLYTLD
ncbi:c-type cytochrome [Noviherbaspirillum sp.]|uniref:c-type cytochrome n=1 Tax=Noviherbaspirillum sp. TaxID=1926288 RepID=UPI002FE01196